MSSERDSRKSPQPGEIPARLRDQVIEGFERLLAGQSLPGSKEPQSPSGISPEIHQRLLAELNLSAPLAGDTPADATSLWHDSATLNRFEIVRPLASGGMGLVSEAIDREFDRPVALKEILPAGANDPAYRVRFQTEAEITARLDHPGIIPVYSRGKLPDGRLYYAMRLISGEHTGTLHQAIRDFYHAAGTGAPQLPATERVLVLRGMIRRVIDVCHTMAYAHRQGVLHRDLKPSNILLGPSGETLVVDWGLARFVHATPEERLANLKADRSDPLMTQVTTGMGTLGHAAPEQLTGDGLLASESTDIYSLGTILYGVLTGHNPFPAKSPGDPAELVKRIRDGAFIPPRQLNPRIDPALEAICLKAMARESARRYPHADDLAADLERALAGESVLAWREPWTRRARRWIARHRTLFATAVVGLVMLTLALGGLSVLQFWNRYKLEQEARKLAAAVTTAQAERDKADLAQQQAERQRNNATANEILAIKAVTLFNQSLANNPELNRDPRLKGLRNTLLREPLPFFQDLRRRLLADEHPSLETLARLRDSSLTLATLHRNIGDIGESLELVRSTLDLCRNALADTRGQTPETIREWRLALAHAYFVQGNLLLANEHQPERLEAFEAALAIWNELSPAAAENPGLVSEQADALCEKGIILITMDRGPEARAAFEQSLALSQDLCQHQPANSSFLRNQARTREQYSRFLDASGDNAGADEQMRLAREIFANLEKNQPLNFEVRSQRAASHFNRGVLLMQRKQHREALNEFRLAEEIWLELSEQSPGNNWLEDNLRYAQINQVAQLKELKESADALPIWQQLVVRLRATVQKSPTVPKLRGTLVESLHNLGHKMIDVNQAHQARQLFAEALEQAEILLVAAPNDLAWLSQSIELRTHLSGFDREEGALELARDRLREILPRAQAAAESPESSTIVRKLYRNLLDMLASIYERQQETAEAESCWQAMRHSAKQDPEMQALFVSLRDVLQGAEPESTLESLELAKQSLFLHETALAERLYRSALDRDPGVAADRQQQIAYQAARAALYEAAKHRAPDEEAAVTLRRRALAWLQSEVQIWRQIAAQNPLFSASVMQSWLRDPALSFVFAAEHRDRLPPDEQSAWQDLLREVQRLRSAAL